MLKFDIHKGKEELFEDLAYKAMHIAVMATKKKVIRNLPGFFSGGLHNVICDALFKDNYEHFPDTPGAFDDFIIPVRAY